MESCATVDEVVAFLEKVDLRPLMTNAMLMFADASGDSVIIEGDRFIRKSGDYQLITNFYQSEQKDDSGQCPRFDAANRVLKARKATTVESCAKALAAAAQTKGKVATLYSNVFDLKKRTVTLWLFHDFETPVVLDLDAELAKGKRVLKLQGLFPHNAAYKAFIGSQQFSRKEMKLLEALNNPRSRKSAMASVKKMPTHRAMDLVLWALDREFVSVPEKMFRGELTRLLLEVSLEGGGPNSEPKILDPRVIETLIDGLLEHDEDCKISGLCLMTLQKVGAKHLAACIPNVIRLLDNRDSLLAAAAFEFLTKNTEMAKNALPKALQVLNSTQPNQVARWEAERKEYKDKRSWRFANERRVRTRAGIFRVTLLGLAADISGAEELDWRGKSALATVYLRAFLREVQETDPGQRASDEDVEASLKFITRLVLDDTLPAFVNGEAFQALCVAFNLSDAQSVMRSASTAHLETVASGAPGELAKIAKSLLSLAK